MNIGDRIRRRREELELSQDDLAKKMGYASRNSIYKYEQMDNMKLTMIEKFADALSVTPGYLMGWSDETQQTMEDLARQATIGAELTQILVSLPDEGRNELMSFARYLKSKYSQSDT